ncbi:MAG: ribosome maturation factor RimM [Defluviitaleaceae bacterium]|nr:ribosome maturation factor RimM [Defluviitaleaceae bacterium]
MADFEIGIITKAQGICGEFRVLPTTDDPSRFELLIGDEVNVVKNGGKTARKLINARQQKGFVILKLEDVDDRNMSETLVGAVISIPAEKALPLDNGEYYIRDLIGLQAESESGENLGKLTQVLHTGANDVYVIESPDGDSFMLPAIKDVVINVSIPQGKIILRLMEGLRELTT